MQRITDGRVDDSAANRLSGTSIRKRLALIITMSLLPALAYAALAGWYHWRQRTQDPPGSVLIAIHITGRGGTFGQLALQ
jgi:hypothetical protein